MSTKEEMLRARDLIKAKRYDEARAILRNIDHPTARDWLDKISQLTSDSAAQPTVYAEPNWQRASSVNLAVEATRSHSKLPIMGMILLLLFAVVGGIGGGVVLFLSSKAAYLIFVSVIIAAAVGGWIISLAVKLGKVREAGAAFFCGLLIGLLIYGTYRYAEYLDFRDFIYNDLLTVEPSLKRGEAEQFIDEILVEETGSAGFLGFVNLEASEGMTIVANRRYSSSGGAEFTLSRELTMIYWVIEVLIMTLGVGFMAVAATRKPFCEDTNQWLKFKMIGQVNKSDIQEFLTLLGNSNFSSASSMIEKKTPGEPFLQVHVGRCHDQSPSATLKVEMVKGRNTDQVLATQISARQYGELVASSQ